MEKNPENAPNKENISEALKKYKYNNQNQPVGNDIPRQNFSNGSYEETMSKETDPDLMMSYEVVKLPSQGLFYPSRISEVNIEYMTSEIREG